MRPAMTLILGAVVVLMVGCRSTDDRWAHASALNVALIGGFNDTACDNAIVRQHTLFPYCFVDDGHTLNELGQHDLTVLASHYKEHPGTLNVRKGKVPSKLYELRLGEVVRLLVEAGVAKERVTIADGPAGGEGMKSERVLAIGAYGQKASAK